MKFLKENKFTIMGFALFMMMFVVDSASAQDIMTTAKDKARDVFTSVRDIMYVLGGFGLVAMAFAALSGKIKWTWVASIAVALAILAAANAIVKYATGEDASLGDYAG